MFLPAIFLFILAIQLMKAGASAVGPQIQGQFPFANGVSTLGTGWLGAYFVLSGSPVAATAISLFGAGTLTKFQTFTMLSGSRLGASFIVLLTGFLYAMRNKDRARGESIGIGIQALTMTAIVYVPGMLIGYAIIRGGVLDGMNWHASAKMEAALGKLWGPIVDLVSARVPGWALFLVGLGVILVSFSLLDRVLPHVSSESTISKHERWLKHPWTMFGLGCLVALLTLSCRSRSPCSCRSPQGLREARGGPPYIMGANITTLADTLVVAMLQNTPAASQIVLAEAIGVTIVSLAILAFFYTPVNGPCSGWKTGPSPPTAAWAFSPGPFPPPRPLFFSLGWWARRALSIRTWPTSAFPIRASSSVSRTSPTTNAWSWRRSPTSSARSSTGPSSW